MKRKITVAAVAAITLCAATSAFGATVPVLTAKVSQGGAVGAVELYDTAKLTGTAAGTGSLTFLLYGPGDPTCEGSAQVWTQPVKGDGEYTSESYFSPAVGTYDYVVMYSGDANNAPVSTACGEANQSVTVTSAEPSIATLASESVMVGGGISDGARLVGGDEPSGAVTFDLYGPGDPSCSLAPIAAYTVPAMGIDFEPRYQSPTYTALAEGTYHWVASYGGDPRNLPVAGSCGDPGESVFVSGRALAPIAIGVRASSSTTIGGQITATASVDTAAGATGTLNFLVYGPGDEDCLRGAIHGSMSAVSGSGEYASGPYVPSSPGVYRFTVTYNGTDGSSATTECSAAGDAVTVSPLEPPVLDRSFTITPISGSVLVGTRASTAGARISRIGFIEIHEPRNLPMGSVVDISTGTARLTTATPGRQRQSGVFGGTKFAVRQRASDRGVVELDMRPSASTHRAECGRAAGGARVARASKLSKKYKARLHAEVNGKFKVKTNYSSTSAHGTSWEVTERCDGTLTRVFTDAVTVVDFRLHRTVIVRAGHHYFARAAG